ncbi:hypothetical protein CcrColossus_gp355 [Caulobacter phage CcrColossus]|uniref:Uncharacterized protein n=1 Tax=Caulobacter phage CcrColossus TaxID=1211640 RepID=K4JV36_9CAUD|nr:hypothetical protein CcrColossus_gp355 [Caulobacter phage CcrColossus]AFU88225.1 hypothetical protein CcrColossus_gp355 [Caulobacter phage CcrColossus]
MSQRHQMVQMLNADILQLNEDGTGKLVDQPYDLIIQLNLNYVDHGDMVDLVELGIQAMAAREDLLKITRENPPHPMTAEDVDVVIAATRQRRFKAEALLPLIRRPGPVR